MKVQSYKNLIVWQKAMGLILAVYDLVSDFPKEEIYGLSSQMKRSANSIPSNIAEGSRRGSKKDFRHFLLNSFGSGSELETQIEISKRLGFGKEEKRKKAEQNLEEVMRMLNRLCKNLDSNSAVALARESVSQNGIDQSEEKLLTTHYSLLTDNRGVAALMAILLVGIFLSIVLTLSAIFIPQLRTSGEVKRSSSAAFAAESAIEWCLYINRIGSTAFPVFANGATVINGITNLPFIEADCVAPPFKAVGTFQDITRSFEISL